MDAQDLTRDTAVPRLAAAPGWYTADLPHAWDFRTPSGGVLMTVAMRRCRRSSTIRAAADLGEHALLLARARRAARGARRGAAERATSRPRCGGALVDDDAGAGASR
jgi:hypothetical protein